VADRNPLAPESVEEVELISDQTRLQGLARVSGHSVEYVSALAAPIFDFRGDLVLSLVLFGFKSTFDISWDGRNAQLLKAAAADISVKLGYVHDTG